MFCEDRLCRPGGYALTDVLLSWMNAPEQGILVDIGCGYGETLRYIHERQPGVELWGVDPAIDDEDPVEGIHLRRGSAQCLPFSTHSVDTILMECSFSRIEELSESLEEIRRVCRPEGRILISDLYLRDEGKSAADRGYVHANARPGVNYQLGRLLYAEEIQQVLREAGFHLLHMQDVSRVLGDWTAQMIMDSRCGEISDLLGTDWKELKRRKIGYYIGIAEVSGLPELVHRAKERSPFYREHLASCPEILTGEAELGRLPTCSAEDLRRESFRMFCESPREIARIITLKSSGSEGLPKRIGFTDADLERTADFFETGIQALVEAGDQVAVFMEGPTHYSVGGLLKEGLGRLPAAVHVFGLIQDYDQAGSRAEGMDTLIGVPSQIYRLARLFPTLRPKTVLLSADHVSDSMKDVIEGIWKCKVFTHWGMSETGYGGAVQCSCREGSHLRDDDLLMEVLDPVTGDPVERGAYGELVLTTLHRQGMPLIRYRTGDVGRLIYGRCGCGYLLPRLDRIRGRLGSAIMLADGRRIWLGDLDEILYAYPILGYQSEWDSSKQQLSIQIQSQEHLPEHEEERLRDEIEGRILKLFGNMAKVEVCLSRSMEDCGRVKKMIRFCEERK